MKKNSILPIACVSLQSGYELPYNLTIYNRFAIKKSNGFQLGLLVKIKECCAHIFFNDIFNHLGSIHIYDFLGVNYCVNFSSPCKISPNNSVDAPTYYSTIHYLVNSSRLINRKCEWTL